MNIIRFPTQQRRHRVLIDRLTRAYRAIQNQRRGGGPLRLCADCDDLMSRGPMACRHCPLNPMGPDDAA